MSQNKLTQITEADLASADHDRWAAAVCKCKSGYPTACIEAQACVFGGCFDEPKSKSREDLEREIEQLTQRRDELSVTINQFSSLLDNHVMEYQRIYDRMLKRGNQNSAFIYKAVLNDTKEFKRLIDAVYKA
ncbi:hypothetical protein [Acinetobacter sp. ANC 3813]|uniref:hypothetical protein n=1 Tax=Acinetobacter sp. ANC 3813 TaxID=1977873 RepID=UPI00111BCFAF|nr:hypothetical protein [Acinetobacter sp. ANC 3813]